MIPPLVHLIASAHDTRFSRGIEELLIRLKICQQLREEPPEPLTEFLREFSGLERVARLPALRLVPIRPDDGPISELLSVLEPKQLVSHVGSPAEGLSLKAGLYMIHDYLDAAHELAQQSDELGHSATAPYWHGIMHRREPDYDNARYWFRRVGSHPIFPEIGSEVGEMLSDKSFAAHLRFARVLDGRGHWDAMAFIDLCEWCGTACDDRAQAAARLQEVEMRRLLEFTCRAAQGEI